MPESHADLIAHPVRLRVLMAIAGRQLTTQQIAELLGDIPPTTLYRHIHKLVEGEILTVVREIPVRGTVEKVYALPEKAAELSKDEVALATPEDRWRYFATFIAALSDCFRAYLDTSDLSSAAQRSISMAHPLFLSAEEDRQFRQELRALIQRYKANPETPERRRSLFATILIPDRHES